MRLTFKLVLAQMLQHPMRIVLTSLAMIAAAAMVVWVVSGYDALVAQFDEFSDDYLGRYHLVVGPEAVESPSYAPAQTVPPRYVPASMLPQISADARVALVEPVLQVRLPVAPARAGGGPSTRPSGEGGPRRRPEGARQRPTTRAATSGPAIAPAPAHRRDFGSIGAPTLVGTVATEPPYQMLEGRWIDPAQGDAALEAAISLPAANRMRLKVGDQVIVAGAGFDYRLTPVGIVEQPGQPGGDMRLTAIAQQGPASLAIYVPMKLAERISAMPGQVSFYNVILRDPAALPAFRDAWAARLKQLDPPAGVLSMDEVRQGLDGEYVATNARAQAYSATAIALLAALFIIFTTLSMGVTERARQLAVLRAVALSKRQVAALVLAESAILAVIGWGGGLAAGWGLLHVVARAKPALMEEPAVLGWWSVALTGACALGGAAVASVLPMIRATAASPLAMMSDRPDATRRRGVTIAMLVGLALISINPLLVFVVPLPDESRYAIYGAVGCSAMAIGFVLLAPLAIRLAERCFGPLLAIALRLDGKLLAVQLSSNLWRTVGTTVALTVGLGLYASLQVWGYSMLNPFVPGRWSPDVIASFLPDGLPDAAIEQVQRIEGIRPGQCLPLAVEQPKLARDLTHSAQRASVTRQDNVILIGADVDAAFAGDRPLFPLAFVDGASDADRAAILAQLKQPRTCLVPDHFLREAGLRVGDAFAMVPPTRPTETVEYRIVGAVSLPGWHWMSKMSGLRLNSVRSAAMVFASYDSVRRDFDLNRTTFFWFNTEAGVTPEDLRPALAAVGQRTAGVTFGDREPGFSTFATPPTLRLTSAAAVRDRIGDAADRTIWQMSQLPLVTLAITSVGVINTIFASVRARRWDFGVLRAVGYTRCRLVRLVMAEALLVGLVACLLSLGLGLMAGWCGAGISQSVSFFGGMNPPLVVPWGQLALGFGATLLLCVLAGLWPALSLSRAEPLRLLQAGRGAL